MNQPPLFPEKRPTYTPEHIIGIHIDWPMFVCHYTNGKSLYFVIKNPDEQRRYLALARDWIKPHE